MNDFFDQKKWLVKTDLCDIMTRHGSDKGSGDHNYTTLYSLILSHLKIKNDVNVFELGIGTTNINIKCNMGLTGSPGASLRGWREWLQNAYIYGADIDRSILFEEDCISTFYVDQCSKDSFYNLWNNDKLRDVSFDLIIDDGLHEFYSNDVMLCSSHHKLKDGGIYIIEDVGNRWMAEMKSNLQKYSAWFKRVEFVEIPHETNNSSQPIYNNNLVILFK